MHSPPVPTPMDYTSAWESPRATNPRRATGGGASRIPCSPVTPCTPVKPVWQQRCEDASARCPYPTHFALKQSSKGEDRLTMDVRMGSDDSLWAVFDGHRSHDVAGFSARIFPSLVWQNDHWPSQPEEALRASLCECHESARREELKGGSTAVILASVGEYLWCCSAGDSRAVAGLNGGGVHRLSTDHTAQVPSEIVRIQAAGGDVEWGMVGGTLPMTRGVGNFDLEAAGFACLPQLSSMLRSGAEFVVVASDGLWDVISDANCCALVRTLSTNNCAAIADELVRTARGLGSADDIAVIVTFFPARGAGGSSAMDMSPSPSPNFPRSLQPTLVSIPSNGNFENFGNFGDFPNFTMHWRPPPAVRELPFGTVHEVRSP
mmetsp:Transcript_117046/g.372662  ORF Transcript_117046/g.372662 Transcript_117046/m.372662 type:complete len:377 (-) Transcript_117046:258-1388(-)